MPQNTFTGSAGPLQFKNFVNQHIKPKFLAKKSNIYEDPLEYESEEADSEQKNQQQLAQLAKIV